MRLHRSSEFCQGLITCRDQIPGRDHVCPVTGGPVIEPCELVITIIFIVQLDR